MLFLDSCDHLANTAADKVLKYIAGPVSIVSGGRTNNCYQTAGAGSTYVTYRAFPAGGVVNVYPTLVFGHAFKTMFLGGRIARLGNPIGSNIQAELWHSYDGRIYVSQTGGSVSAGSEGVLTLGVWYYIEWSCHFQVITNGIAQEAICDHIVKVNNDTVLEARTSGGPIPTLAAERGWSYFGIVGGPGLGLGAYADDIYCTDGEFLGDIKIGVIRPDAPGGEADFTPTGEATDWEATKDQTPDYDTSYITSSTPAQQETVNLEDPGLIGPIKGIQANFVVKKTDAGACSFIPRYYILGTPYDSVDNEFFPSWEGWKDFVEGYRKNPLTGNDWTLAEVNSLQMGMTRNT